MNLFLKSKMFLPVPFHSYFLKKFSNADGEYLLFEDFDASFNLAKHEYEADASSTHDETELSSLIWDDINESRKQPSLTLEEAEMYTNYLDSESIAEPIRLLPFHSIHLHEQTDYHSSIASTTHTVEDTHEERCLAPNVNNYEIWWGVEGETNVFYNQTGAPTVEFSSATDLSSEDSSTTRMENSSQDDKSTEYSEEFGAYRIPEIPRTIEFNPDQQNAAINRDSWLFDPVETLVLGKPPLTGKDDAHWMACSRLQELLASHVKVRQSGTINRDDTDNIANICAILDQCPQIAQVRYRVALIRQEESRDHCKGSKSDTFLSLPCFPLSIFCATGHLQGVRSCYEAYPDAIGYVDKWLGTALHYACSNCASVSVVQFLLDRFPEAARITNRQYQSSLHLACSVRSSPLDRMGYPQLRIVKFLLECFPTAARLADENGCTPMHVACKVGAPVEVLAALTQSSTGVLQMSTRTLEKALHITAFRSKCSETVRFLLSKDPSQAAAIDDKMQTPLHKACMAKVLSTEIVYLLVNAYPNALTMRDDNIETPCDIAIRLGNASTEILRILDPQ